MFSHVDTVVLRVRDRAAAVEWYRSRLGLEMVFNDRTTGMAVLILGRGNSLTLWELGPDEKPADPDSAATFPVFEAADAAGQREVLLARGVRTSPLREVPGLRSFCFWDLDGNRLEAWEMHHAETATRTRFSESGRSQ